MCRATRERYLSERLGYGLCLGDGIPVPEAMFWTVGEAGHYRAVTIDSSQTKIMKDAVFGAVLIGCWAIGLFFFRHWRETGGRLSWYFGAAFWLLAAQRLLFFNVSLSHEYLPYAYGVRLVAFLLILYAVYCQNGQPPSTLSE